MVGGGFCGSQKKADWLNTLLQCSFFEPCALHHDSKKNEKNSFCIDCNLELCKSCSTDHGLHNRLQICRYVYQDVVKLKQIQNYFNCSDIQTYKINGEKSVLLHPRPQSKDAKSSSTKPKTGTLCEACGKCIHDSTNRFCSIACKVFPVEVRPEGQSQEPIPLRSEPLSDLIPEETGASNSNLHEKESSNSLRDSSEDAQTMTNAALRPRKRRRKGIPRRAPLF